MGAVKGLKYIFVAMISLTVIALMGYCVFQTGQESSVAAEHSHRSFSDSEKVILCYEDLSNFTHKWVNDLPIIYFITPTYPRREQIPEMTRLGQTLMHVQNLHWIVADDNNECNPTLVRFLKKFGIPLTVMATPMPRKFWKRDKTGLPRGVANRRAALDWIRKNGRTNGVLYFGDDDNTFDLQLFHEIRYTKKVSMLPVGLIGDFGVSSPVVKEGKVIGFFDSWPVDRKFPIDMAGFAVSVEFFKNIPEASMPYKVGYEEDMFLKSLGLCLEDIEPVADQCTKILVWHTQTTKKPPGKLLLAHKESHTSLDGLLDQLYDYGVASIDNKTGVKTYYTKQSGRMEV